MSAIREKFTTLRKTLRPSKREGSSIYDGDTDCDCEEAFEDLLDRVGKLEAALQGLRPSVRSLEKKMGEMEAKVDVLEKCVGEMKGLKIERKLEGKDAK